MEDRLNSNEDLQSIVSAFLMRADQEEEESILFEYENNVHAALMESEAHVALEAIDKIARNLPEGDSKLRAEVLLDRGQILVSLLQTVRSLKVLKEACRMSAKCRYSPGMARGSVLIAEALLHRADKEGASKSLDLAQNVLNRSGIQEEELQEQIVRLRRQIEEMPAEREDDLVQATEEEQEETPREPDERELLLETAREDAFGPQQERLLAEQLKQNNENGYYDESLALLNDIEKALPAESIYRTRIMMFTAQTLEESGSIAQAIGRYEEVLEKIREKEPLNDPNYDKAVENLSDLYREQEDYAADVELRSADFNLKCDVKGEEDEASLDAADQYMESLMDVRDYELLAQMVLWRAEHAGSERVLNAAAETLIYDAWQKNEDAQICELCEGVYRNPLHYHKLRNSGVIRIWFAAAVHESRIGRACELYDAYERELSGDHDQYYLWTLKELAQKCASKRMEDDAIRFYSDAVRWCSKESQLHLEKMMASEFADYMESRHHEEMAEKIRREHLQHLEGTESKDEEQFEEPVEEPVREEEEILEEYDGEEPEAQEDESEFFEEDVPEDDGSAFEEEDSILTEPEDTDIPVNEEMEEELDRYIQEEEEPESEVTQEELQQEEFPEEELQQPEETEDLPVTDEDQIEALQHLAGVYESIGDYQRATMILSDEVRLRIQVYGAEDPNTVATLANLAEDFYLAGNVPRAVMIQNRVVAGFMQTLGEQDAMTCEARDRLADMMEANGQLADAYRLREALYLTMATNAETDEELLDLMKDKLVRIQKKLL